MPHGGNKRLKGLPMIVFYGKDRCLVNLKKSIVVRYKYFNLADTNAIGITARGKGEIACLAKKARSEKFAYRETCGKSIKQM